MDIARVHPIANLAQTQHRHEREANIVKGNRKNKHYISTKGFTIPPIQDARSNVFKSRANPAWQTINNPSALLKNLLSRCKSISSHKS